MDNSEYKSEYSHQKVKVNQVYNTIRTGHVNIKLITNINTYTFFCITKCELLLLLLLLLIGKNINNELATF